MVRDILSRIETVSFMSKDRKSLAQEDLHQRINKVVSYRLNKLG